jgi:alpha-tubulin N-acetyltransferase 1
MIVDEMGKASARAQDLKMPITTAEKLSKSDHTIYLFSEQTNEEYVYFILHTSLLCY